MKSSALLCLLVSNAWRISQWSAFRDQSCAKKSQESIGIVKNKYTELEIYYDHQSMHVMPHDRALRYWNPATKVLDRDVLSMYI